MIGVKFYCTNDPDCHIFGDKINLEGSKSRNG